MTRDFTGPEITEVRCCKALAFRPSPERNMMGLSMMLQMRPLPPRMWLRSSGNQYGGVSMAAHSCCCCTLRQCSWWHSRMAPCCRLASDEPRGAGYLVTDCLLCQTACTKHY